MAARCSATTSRRRSAASWRRSASAWSTAPPKSSPTSSLPSLQPPCRARDGLPAIARPRPVLTVMAGRVQTCSCFNTRDRGKIDANSPPKPVGSADRCSIATILRPSRRIPMPAVSLTVNGKPVIADIDPRTLLVQFLRENLRLTGTHVGCDTSQCGACVVHVNGVAMKSCTLLTLSVDGANVLTIEGVATGDKLHPMQEAFRENHGLQCGFCTPGMIMSALDIVRRKGHELDEKTIRHELDGNLCRCTGYHNIVKAIAAGARAMGGGAPTQQAAE